MGTPGLSGTAQCISTLTHVNPARVVQRGIEYLEDSLDTEVVKFQKDDDRKFLINSSNRSLFLRLLTGEIEVNRVLGADLTNAQSAVRHLTLHQLAELRLKCLRVLPQGKATSPAHLSFFQELDLRLYYAFVDFVCNNENSDPSFRVFANFPGEARDRNVWAGQKQLIGYKLLVALGLAQKLKQKQSCPPELQDGLSFAVWRVELKVPELVYLQVLRHRPDLMMENRKKTPVTSDVEDLERRVGRGVTLNPEQMHGALQGVSDVAAKSYQRLNRAHLPPRPGRRTSIITSSRGGRSVESSLDNGGWGSSTTGSAEPVRTGGCTEDTSSFETSMQSQRPKRRTLSLPPNRKATEAALQKVGVRFIESFFCLPQMALVLDRPVGQKVYVAMDVTSSEPKASAGAQQQRWKIYSVEPEGTFDEFVNPSDAWQGCVSELKEKIRDRDPVDVSSAMRRIAESRSASLARSSQSDFSKILQEKLQTLRPSRTTLMNTRFLESSSSSETLLGDCPMSASASNVLSERKGIFKRADAPLARKAVAAEPEVAPKTKVKRVIGAFEQLDSVDYENGKMKRVEDPMRGCRKHISAVKESRTERSLKHCDAAETTASRRSSVSTVYQVSRESLDPPKLRKHSAAEIIPINLRAATALKGKAPDAPRLRHIEKMRSTLSTVPDKVPTTSSVQKGCSRKFSRKLRAGAYDEETDVGISLIPRSRFSVMHAVPSAPSAASASERGRAAPSLKEKRCSVGPFGLTGQAVADIEGRGRLEKPRGKNGSIWTRARSAVEEQPMQGQLDTSLRKPDKNAAATYRLKSPLRSPSFLRGKRAPSVVQ